MEFFEGIIQLVFSKSGTYSGSESYPLAVFSATSGLMGGLVVVLDWLMVQVNKGSALKLTYRGGNVFTLILIWGIGAGLGGFIGASFGILQLNRAACITVGVGWTLILPRIMKSVETEKEDVEDFEDASV